MLKYSLSKQTKQASIIMIVKNDNHRIKQLLSFSDKTIKKLQLIKKVQKAKQTEQRFV